MTHSYFSLDTYSKRRSLLAKQMQPNSMSIVFAGEQMIRNGDTHAPFRQNSDFYYITGFKEPKAVAFICVDSKKNMQWILFNQCKNTEEEIWTGKRLGQEGACAILGADMAYPIESLTEHLPQLLSSFEVIYFNFSDKQAQSALWPSIEKIKKHSPRANANASSQLRELTPLLHELRLIKDHEEIACMRKAASISVKAHQRTMSLCKPFCTEAMLEAELQYHFHLQGAKETAYPSIVGSGENSCILHYTDNNKMIENDDMVLIDAGCEYNCYASDITRTFPASGVFSNAQKAIYNLVLHAQMEAIQLIRPGLPWIAIQHKILQVLTQGLVDLGVLSGHIDDLITTKAYMPFYMHQSGHWLGLDVHDVGSYQIKGESRRLEAGMVLTVEPGLYFHSEKSPECFKNIGVRIEDDILVTPTGHDILTGSLVKTTEEIEYLMKNT